MSLKKYLKKNEEILKKILETSLGVNIKKIKIQNTERNQGNIYVRRKNLDILLDTNKGIIDIEMNSVQKDYLHTRNMAYLCDTYSHYTLVGEEYQESMQIIQLNFTYGMGSSDKEIVRKYSIQNDSKEKYVQNFLIVEYNMDRVMEIW